MQKSANYDLKLFEGTDNVKRQDFVDNFQKIDSVLKATNDKLGDSVKKDSTIQTGLNAEMVGGKHASDILTLSQISKNTIYNANIDNVLDGGFIRFRNCVGNIPNGYTENNDFILLNCVTDVIGYKWIRQTLWDVRSTNTYTRQKNDSAWTSWTKVLNEDDYNTLFQFASDGKNSIANAIAGKGGSANNGMTFNQLASAINSMSSAKSAQGTSSPIFYINPSKDQYDGFVLLNLSNIGFSPDIVLATTSCVVQYANNAGTTPVTYFSTFNKTNFGPKLTYEYNGSSSTYHVINTPVPTAYEMYNPSIYNLPFDERNIMLTCFSNSDNKAYYRITSATTQWVAVKIS